MFEQMRGSWAQKRPGEDDVVAEQQDTKFSISNAADKVRCTYAQRWHGIAKQEISCIVFSPFCVAWLVCSLRLLSPPPHEGTFKLVTPKWNGCDEASMIPTQDGRVCMQTSRSSFQASKHRALPTGEMAPVEMPKGSTFNIKNQLNQ
jgi:hypothetical protein